MKLTKSKLKQIIKEELQKVLNEEEAPPHQRPLYPPGTDAKLCGDDGICQKVCMIKESCERVFGVTRPADPERPYRCVRHKSLSAKASAPDNLAAWRTACRTRQENARRYGTKPCVGGICPEE